MSNYTRPGVYVNEVLRAVTPQGADLVTQGVSTGVLVGALKRGPTAPTFVRSWTEYSNTFGSFEGGDVAYAAYQFFLNGGSLLGVQRVLGAGATAATRSLNDRAGTALPTLSVTAKSVGAWGNDLRVSVSDATSGRFNLTIFQGGAAEGNIREQWLDLSMNPSDDRYVVTRVNHPIQGSGYVTVANLNSATTPPDNTPAVQAATTLVGGTDGGAVTNTDLSNVFALDGASPLDDITFPFNLNLPGVHATVVINSALTYAAAREDVFVVIDPEEGDTVSEVITQKESYNETSYGAVYYPRFWITDPNSSSADAVKLVAPGGAILGRYASTDNEIGPWKPAAGLTAEVRGGIQLERKLRDAELGSLNSNNVNAIRNIAGNGLRIMGARTLKKRQADKYLSVRRNLIYIKDNLKRNTEFALFEANAEPLWSNIEAVVSGWLTALHSQGGLRGATADQAFYVKCDADLNTQAQIDQGQVKVEVGVALLQPAEFIIITIGQTTGAGATTSEG
jgi:uncharacterized protein